MAPFLMMVLTQHVVLVCSRSTLRRASLVRYLATTACIPVCIGQRAEHTHTDALVHRSVGAHVVLGTHTPSSGAVVHLRPSRV